VPDRVRPDDQPALLVDDEPETGDDIDAELSDDEIYPRKRPRSMSSKSHPGRSTATRIATRARNARPVL
jgi:hypothetical protein